MLSSKVCLISLSISSLIFTSCGKKEFNRADPEIQDSAELTDGTPILPGKSSAVEDIFISDEQQTTGSIARKEPIKACVEYILDFDRSAKGTKISRGEVINDQYRAWGVTIAAKNNLKRVADVAITFDSSNPSGNDLDLRTPGSGNGNNNPLYNLLIIPEYITDNNKDGLVDDPNDSAKGGVIIFHFDRPTEIRSVDMIDIEEKATYIELYDEAGQVIRTNVPNKGDNSVQKIRWKNNPKVIKAKIILEGSGAVDNLHICTDVLGKK